MSWLTWYWPLALVFIALILFPLPEFLAVRGGGMTFSAFMAYMARDSKFGPIWCFLWGGLVFGLLVHFSGWCIGPCL